MNWKVLSYLCCYFAVFLLICSLSDDIANLNKIFIVIFGCLLLYLSYRFNKLSKYVWKDTEKYGYLYNKFIDINSVPVFRDIPCNGNLYYAYVLIKLNNFKFDNGNILGAIMLKWIKDEKIVVRKENNKNCIDLTMKPKFELQFEDELFRMVYEASENGLLDINEFNIWAKNYDMRILGLFIRMETEIINQLKKRFHIYHRVTEEECFYQYVMDDTIYNDSIELYGFKKFLEDFSLMNDKDVKELHLWEDYMIFATLFGMTDKVSKQLKDIYPDIDDIDMFDLI